MNGKFLELKHRLESCPYCGERHDLYFDVTESWRGEVSFWHAEVVCRKCHARRHGYDLWTRDEALESAIEKWNMRNGEIHET